MDVTSFLPTIVKVSNVSSFATLEKMKNLFSYLGELDDIKMYPSEDNMFHSEYRVCYVKYAHPWSVNVSVHLTNTVFFDRALIVTPIHDGSIPNEEKVMLDFLNPAPALPGLGTLGGNCDLINNIAAINGQLMISTVDPKLSVLSLLQYPPLPASLDPEVIEEIRRTVYIGNLNPNVKTGDLLRFLNQIVGEVKFVRMAGDDSHATRFAFVEFTDRTSIIKALQSDGVHFEGRQLKINHSSTAIVKPVKAKVTVGKEIEEAMKRVKAAEDLISATVEPEISKFGQKHKYRSRSRSRSRFRHHRRSSTHTSRSRTTSHRSKHRSRSKESLNRSIFEKTSSCGQRYDHNKSPHRSPHHSSSDIHQRSSHRSPSISQRSSPHKPTTFRKSSHRSPSTSRRSSHCSPSTSRRSSQCNLSTSRRSSHHSPSVSRKSSHPRPSTSRKSSHRSPSISRKSSHRSPSTSRKSSHHSPSTSRKSTHHSSSTSRRSSRTSFHSQKISHRSKSPRKSSHHSPSAFRRFGNKSPSASRRSSHHSPSASRISGSNSPSASQRYSNKNPSASRRSADKSPSASQRSSHHNPSASRISGNNSPSASQRSSHHSPSASRNSSRSRSVSSHKHLRSGSASSSQKHSETPNEISKEPEGQNIFFANGVKAESTLDAQYLVSKDDNDSFMEGQNLNSSSNTEKKSFETKIAHDILKGTTQLMDSKLISFSCEESFNQNLARLNSDTLPKEHSDNQNIHKENKNDDTIQTSLINSSLEVDATNINDDLCSKSEPNFESSQSPRNNIASLLKEDKSTNEAAAKKSPSKIFESEKKKSCMKRSSSRHRLRSYRRRSRSRSRHHSRSRRSQSSIRHQRSRHHSRARRSHSSSIKPSRRKSSRHRRRSSIRHRSRSRSKRYSGRSRSIRLSSQRHRSKSTSSSTSSGK